MIGIDLNCDMGEREGEAGLAADVALLGVVTSANIACGGHAGDTETMRRVVAAAAARGVAVGAHPGYPDRANFGRVEVAASVEDIERFVAEQVGAMAEAAETEGTVVRHVKPHGALYHAAMVRADVARAVARGVMAVGGRGVAARVWLVGQAGASGVGVWRGMGMAVREEAFADRRYEADGRLRGRSKAGALIGDAREAAAQAVSIALRRGVATEEGGWVPVEAGTICIHSDTPEALENARAVRAALEGAGVRCAAHGS